MKDLLNAILEVRKATGSVLKKGHNDFHNYSYATANDVIAEVRNGMNEHGIVVFPKEMKDFTYFKDGQVEQYTQIFSVFHSGTGQSMDVSIRCAGEDKGDKKAYKSNTGALKYLLIQLFLLPTGDDPEATTETGQKTAQQQAAQVSRQMAGRQVAPPQQQQQAAPAPQKWLNKGTGEWRAAARWIAEGNPISSVKSKYKINKTDEPLLMQDAQHIREHELNKKEEVINGQ